MAGRITCSKSSAIVCQNATRKVNIQFKKADKQRALFWKSMTGLIGYKDNSACLLPMAAGKCRAQIPSYFFNAETASCLPFVYTGCKGNENNFRSIQECTRKCHDYLLGPVTPPNPTTAAPTTATSAAASKNGNTCT